MRRAPPPMVRVPAMRKAPPARRGGSGGAGARVAAVRPAPAPTRRAPAAPRRPAALPMRVAPADARARDGARSPRDAAVAGLAERWVHYRSSVLAEAKGQLKSGGLVEIEVLDTGGVMRGLLICEVIGTALDALNGLALTYVTPLAANDARILQWATGNISAPNAIHFSNRPSDQVPEFSSEYYVQVVERWRHRDPDKLAEGPEWARGAIPEEASGLPPATRTPRLTRSSRRAMPRTDGAEVGVAMVLLPDVLEVAWPIQSVPRLRGATGSWMTWRTTCARSCWSRRLAPRPSATRRRGVKENLLLMLLLLVPLYLEADVAPAQDVDLGLP